MRGRSPKCFLSASLEEERALHQVLPKNIADLLAPNSSRLSHLHGLPTTRNAVLV